ncbi:MAG: glycosyltransferase [Candidatus Omnitrophica bacterium]|nr:glycosyltransferase [Candidatus Omnitrophota bacterium]
MPIVSVVIPLYNKVNYVGRAIESVLFQTVHDFEVIVVNDGSTDGSEKVVEGYRDSRIRLIHRDSPSPGGHRARNEGIRNARSDFIAFLDADDEWKDKFLETVLRLRDKFPSAGGYATAYEEREGDKIKMPKFWFIPEGDWEGLIPDYFKSCVYGTSPVCTSAVAIPKYVFDMVGYFPEGVKKGGDLDMWARIALRYPVAFSRYIGATYYKDVPGSVVKTYKVEKYRAVDTIEEYLKSNPNMPEKRKKHIREYANRLRLKSAKVCINTGELKLAITHLKNCHTRIFIKKKLGLYLKALFLQIKRNKQ